MSALGEEQDESKKSNTWKRDLEFNLLSTRGNTNLLSFGSSANLEGTWDEWSSNFGLSFFKSSDDGRLQSESYSLNTKGARKYPFVDVFLGLDYNANEFAGFLNQYKISLGASKEIYNNQNNIVNFELAPVFVFEEPLAGEFLKFGALSAKIVHRHQFSESSKWNNKFSYELNLKDTEDARYEFETSISASISGNFSTKVSYLAQYRAQPPLGVGDFDGRTQISLLSSW